MSKTLEDLYAANQNKRSSSLIYSQDFQQAAGRISMDRNYLLHELKGEQKAAFIRLLTAMDTIKERECVERFVDGVRTGVRLVCELKDQPKFQSDGTQSGDILSSYP